MENPEEILQSLEEFAKLKPKDIPRELEEYLCFVAKTGDPVYQWSAVKSLFREKLLSVITDFYESCPSIDIPPCPNVDIFNYETMKNFILEKLDTFSAAPFTVQRICELLTSPRKEYNRIDKYMRALEKNILVVSTTEPGNRRNAENGDNFVNGLESEHSLELNSNSDINVEEMDDTAWPHVNENDPSSATISEGATMATSGISGSPLGSTGVSESALNTSGIITGALSGAATSSTQMSSSGTVVAESEMLDSAIADSEVTNSTTDSTIADESVTNSAPTNSEVSSESEAKLKIEPQTAKTIQEQLISETVAENSCKNEPKSNKISDESLYVSIEPVVSNTCSKQPDAELDVTVTITAIPAAVQKRRDSIEPIISSEIASEQVSSTNDIIPTSSEPSTSSSPVKEKETTDPKTESSLISESQVSETSEKSKTLDEQTNEVKSSDESTVTDDSLEKNEAISDLKGEPVEQDELDCDVKMEEGPVAKSVIKEAISSTTVEVSESEINLSILTENSSYNKQAESYKKDKEFEKEAENLKAEEVCFEKQKVFCENSIDTHNEFSNENMFEKDETIGQQEQSEIDHQEISASPNSSGKQTGKNLEGFDKQPMFGHSAPFEKAESSNAEQTHPAKGSTLTEKKADLQDNTLEEVNTTEGITPIVPSSDKIISEETELSSSDEILGLNHSTTLDPREGHISSREIPETQSGLLSQTEGNEGHDQILPQKEAENLTATSPQEDPFSKGDGSIPHEQISLVSEGVAPREEPISSQDITMSQETLQSSTTSNLTEKDEPTPMEVDGEENATISTSVQDPEIV